MRLGAGSIPKSECFVAGALVFGFLIAGAGRTSSSDCCPSSLSLNDGSESTLITLRLADEEDGGGSERPLPLGLRLLEKELGGGSLEASPDLGGGSKEPSLEEDG